MPRRTVRTHASFRVHWTETLHASTTSQLRLFNLCGLFFCRKQLGISGWWVLVYLFAWLRASPSSRRRATSLVVTSTSSCLPPAVVAFFLPQPGYLGPSKVRNLSGEVSCRTSSASRFRVRYRSILMRFGYPMQEFETQVLLLPPASTFSSDASGAAPRIVELPASSSSTSTSSASSTSSRSPPTFHLVHFHVPHSSTSRDLHMTLSRLSSTHASPSLAFCVLDASADETQSAFYDVGLATGPTSRDVPLVRLYERGKVRVEAPASEGEAKRAVRRRRLAERKVSKGAEAEAEESEEDESEDEREVEQERALSRYRWDTSAVRCEVSTRRLRHCGCRADVVPHLSAHRLPLSAPSACASDQAFRTQRLSPSNLASFSPLL